MRSLVTALFWLASPALAAPSGQVVVCKATSPALGVPGLWVFPVACGPAATSGSTDRIPQGFTLYVRQVVQAGGADTFVYSTNAQGTVLWRVPVETRLGEWQHFETPLPVPGGGQIFVESATQAPNPTAFLQLIGYVE